MIKKCIKCGRKLYCSDMCENHFKEYFEKKVRKTIRKFKLLDRKEKIGVAVSGGKDSTVCMHILKNLGYDVTGLTVDALIGNYTKENLKNLKSVCKKYKIPLEILSFRKEFGYSLCYIRDVLKEKGYDYSSCMICGILRRFLINKYAKKLKLDVIATGHNLDDEAQAFIMNVFRNDKTLALRQGPVSGKGISKHFVKRVKPLYLCSEKETTAYSKLMNFPVNYKPCPCRVGAYRKKYLDMLDDFEKKFPATKNNIIAFYLRMIYPQKQKVKGEANKCELCSEPASKEICRKCQIILSLKNR